MSFAGFDRDHSVSTVVACLCSQSCGSDDSERGVDSAVSLVCQTGRPMGTEVPQLRQEAYQTLVRVQQKLKAFCSYSMGVDFFICGRCLGACSGDGFEGFV